MDDITVLDYLLLPLYLWIIYKIALYYRNKYYREGHPYHPYFIPALTAKIAGATFIGLFYYYYYGGGDTFNYFFHVKIINSTFSESPVTWLRLITHHADMSNVNDGVAVNEMYWYDDGNAYFVSCIGAFIGIFCFTKYLIISIISSAISFIGMWLLFITFAEQYPAITRYIAIAVLFLPGPVVWGSGLFKDTYCMFAIGCLVYCTYQVFEKLRFNLIYFMLAGLSCYLLIQIKAYILIGILPFLALKIMLAYRKKLITGTHKIIFAGVLVMLLLTGYRSYSRILTALSQLSVEQALSTIKTQKDYLLRQSEKTDGSAYDLGDFEPTIGGISKMFVPAVNVTFFRPYLWEAHSIIQLFSALESFAILLLTLYLLFFRNQVKTLKKIFTDPNLIFCLGFALFFGFIVGVSSYNFGSLSRYKIPCMPFLGVFLAIAIFDRAKENEKQAELSAPATQVQQDTCLD